MLNRVFIFCLAVCFSTAINAQTSHTGIGSGVSFQLGLNPASEYFTWTTETDMVILRPHNRFFAGPSIQFKNFRKWQVEASVLYSNSVFRSIRSDAINIQDIRVNEWQLPISINYNAVSPIRFHSSIVYHGGILLKNAIIQEQGKITNRYNFFTPALFAGIRLASELMTIGRIEYGITYTHNLKGSHVLYAENQDSAPSRVVYNQKDGQWRATLVYYFSPRTYKWSKDRYNLLD